MTTEEYPDFHGDMPISHAKICKCGGNCKCKKECNSCKCGCNCTNNKCTCEACKCENCK